MAEKFWAKEDQSRRAAASDNVGKTAVASEAAKGIAQASMESGVPILFGVLTTDTIEQAIERAGAKAGNKGSDVAVAAIEMVDLLQQF